MNDEFRNSNDETKAESIKTRRYEFADFLERLAVTMGRCERLDWDRFAVKHYLDDEMEQMRQTVVRLGISWAYRDWPELNCELVLGFAKTLRDR